jgi:plastocyanin
MHSITKKSAVALFSLLVILTLALAACGSSSGPSGANTPANEVDMGATTFVQTSVTISTGQSVHFVDQQSGTTHILCVGSDGHCDASATAPQDLASPGFTIQPGQSQDVRFDTPGTYTVTCTIHPNMNVSVIVR